MMEMDRLTLGQGMKLVKSRALGSSCTQMVACMQVTGAMIKPMVKDGFSFLTETHSKEIGSKTKCTETELICTLMAPSMLVYGKMI